MAQSEIALHLANDLKAAMRSKDKDRLACIRQVKAKAQEAANAPDFEAEEDDAFYQKVIAAYVKTLKRGIEELGAAGDKGEALRTKYQVEIDYLAPLLPQMLDATATGAIVAAAIAESGVSGAAQVGRVMGLVMKGHKGKVDPALVRRLAEEQLGS